ncbi:hypothetical protein [Paenibacillus harenae]|uniref:Uncharacterized protein n=1 Tax=Paenibacillus harenae TaxID=306543 RepID=A0ABT9UB00_PAEHA|nr:hypothetical protein [Paenibacillus harenae]MDQ0116812.1 hypothetical protein [Paenibacillus harenae]
MNPVNSTGLWFDPILINNPIWIQHQAIDYSPGAAAQVLTARFLNKATTTYDTWRT